MLMEKWANMNKRTNGKIGIYYFYVKNGVLLLDVTLKWVCYYLFTFKALMTQLHIKAIRHIALDTPGSCCVVGYGSLR